MICVVINLTSRGFVLICILYLKHFYRAVSLQIVTTEPAVVPLGQGITTWSPFCCCAAHETNTVIQSTGFFFSTCLTSRIVVCELSVTCRDLSRQVDCFQENPVLLSRYFWDLWMYQSCKVSSSSQRYLNTSMPQDTHVFECCWSTCSFPSPRNTTLKGQKISYHQSKI
jgi:hypothetical protein